MTRQGHILISVALLPVAWAQQSARSVQSLTATIQDSYTRKLSDGNVVTTSTTGRFYRDSQGRTRTERGNLIVIQDPTKRTTIVIDNSSQTARRFSGLPNPQGASGPSMSDVTGAKPVSLGNQVISGVETRGTRATAVIPAGAVGNMLPITQTVEVWRSDDLALPIMLKSTDPLNGEHVQLYQNITTGAQVDPSLFAVPTGVKVIDSVAGPLSGSTKLRPAQ